MYGIIFRTFFLFTVTASIISCTKPGPTGPEPDAPGGVYVAYSTGAQYYSREGRLWHEGSEKILQDEVSSLYINDLAVAANGDTYATGCECWKTRSVYSPTILTDSCKLVLWKNTEKQILSPTAFSYLTKSLIALNDAGEPYIAGTELLGNGSRGIIRLWKNGNKQDVTNGSTDAEAICLVVSGNDVYIGGEEKADASNTPTKAVLWKNGIAHTFTTDASLSSYVSAIAVSGPDVYVAINEGNSKAWVAKNNVKLSLPANLKSVQDIFTSGVDLYVLGSVDFGSTSVWKNGTLLYKLDYPPSSATTIKGQRIFVKEADVYVAGRVQIPAGETAVIWKNGAVLNSLTNSLITSVEGLQVR